MARHRALGWRADYEYLPKQNATIGWRFVDAIKASWRVLLLFAERGRLRWLKALRASLVATHALHH